MSISRCPTEPCSHQNKSTEMMSLSERKPELEVQEAQEDYPKGVKLTPITIALCLAVFCMALVGRLSIRLSHLVLGVR